MSIDRYKTIASFLEKYGEFLSRGKEIESEDFASLIDHANSFSSFSSPFLFRPSVLEFFADKTPIVTNHPASFAAVPITFFIQNHIDSYLGVGVSFKDCGKILVTLSVFSETPFKDFLDFFNQNKDHIEYNLDSEKPAGFFS